MQPSTRILHQRENAAPLRVRVRHLSNPVDEQPERVCRVGQKGVALGQCGVAPTHRTLRHLNSAVALPQCGGYPLFNCFADGTVAMGSEVEGTATPRPAHLDLARAAHR